jgi:sortase A
MALYKYIKAPPPQQENKPLFQRLSRMRPQMPRISLPTIHITLPSLSLPTISIPAIPRHRQAPAYAPAYDNSPAAQQYQKRKRWLASGMAFVGISLIAWVSYPIISFEIMSRTKFANNIVQPVPSTQSALGWNQVSQILDERKAALTSENEVNVPPAAVRPAGGAVAGVTALNTWLPHSQQQTDEYAGRFYFLSIPKLDIQDALVKIGGESLDESLIHYGGTGIPGDYGNSVIFGHSILPAFYDPTNYKAIFSYLPSLEPGDDIFVKYDGLTYRYVVYDMRVTTPDDITILEQRYDTSYLTLITCVPPGTYWKRLEIKARLEPM